MTREELRRGIECLLFVSDGPLGAREMSLALDTPEELVAEAETEYRYLGEAVEQGGDLRKVRQLAILTQIEHGTGQDDAGGPAPAYLGWRDLVRHYL